MKKPIILAISGASGSLYAVEFLKLMREVGVEVHAVISEAGRKVMEIIKQANRDYKTTIVMVTHERDYAAEAPRQIVLVDGKIAGDLKKRATGRAGKVR